MASPHSYTIDVEEISMRQHQTIIENVYVDVDLFAETHLLKQNAKCQMN